MAAAELSSDSGVLDAIVNDSAVDLGTECDAVSRAAFSLERAQTALVVRLAVRGKFQMVRTLLSQCRSGEFSDTDNRLLLIAYEATIQDDVEMIVFLHNTFRFHFGPVAIMDQTEFERHCGGPLSRRPRPTPPVAALSSLEHSSSAE